ncbi:Probable RNA-directed DNA polymerase from transposon BS [Eumeta japonica]|uniref:Probable RNA-directed DNA polymerase from transposon BS n=1 Tax=Eumeta variegata TaxID=151549 RepID=A0A4C1Z1L0_EUMVA|nr:Probable RNA-directed DNA polymerase from transposon BS [Eumeta japonica]
MGSLHWPADPNKKPDLLDFYIKNIPLSQLDVEESTDLSSDHTPVIVNVHCQPERNVEKSLLQEGKTPGYDLVDAKLLKELPEKGIIHFAAICNACLRLAIFPGQWKIAQVVMIPKPGKPLHEASSYRPISLLSVPGKIFERMLLNRMREYLSDVISQHQFGFREKHGTIEQIHRITDIISRTLEFKQFCSAVFLDISQAFDRVWHEGLLYKIKKLLPHSFFPILKSYLEGRCFEVKYNNESSPLKKINSGVPQGSILGPVLYLIFTADIPTHEDTITATYADDTALLSVDKDSSTASAKLQAHVFKVENWLDKWRIRVNQGNSVHVTFTLRRETCPPIKLHNEEIPQSEDAKYLGMHLDRRLTWRKHIWTKRKQLDTQLRSMYWLMGRKSNLSHESKIVIYKTILKPIWTYGIQLWGTASNSNIEILERFQSKTLRTMLDIPYYVSNKYIHQDLRMNTVKQEIAKHSKNYQMRISTHVNGLALNLTGAGSVSHFRLKRHSVPTLAVRFDHS